MLPFENEIIGRSFPHTQNKLDFQWQSYLSLSSERCSFASVFVVVAVVIVCFIMCFIYPASYYCILTILEKEKTMATAHTHTDEAKQMPIDRRTEKARARKIRVIRSIDYSNTKCVFERIKDAHKNGV